MQKKSLEEAIKNLEKIILQMENEELSITECLWLYTKGMRLVRFCDRELDKKEEELERRKAEI